MTLTLSDVLRSAYYELGQLNYAKATGGSTTSAIVGSLANEGSNNDWKDSGLFVDRDAGGLGAAPEGEFAVVSSYVDATGTFNLDSTLTAAIAAGDRIAYTSPRWSLQQSIGAVNHALAGMGDFTLVDQDTLVIVSGQTEYECGVDWKYAGKPVRIDIELDKDDTDDQEWIEIKDWEFEPATAGSAGKIIFQSQYSAGYYCRVWYRAPHPAVNLYNDVIHELIHPELVKWAVVVEMLKWMNERTQGEERGIVQNLNDSRSEYENALRKHPLANVQRKSKLFIW